MTYTKPDYFTLTITVNKSEDDCYELHEHGALGSELLSEKMLRCFLSNDQAAISSIEALCSLRGWTINSKEQCEDKNWVQECEDVWQPLAVDEFRIYPLLDQKEIPPHDEKTILIVPGEGFGTGHHPSTRLAMGLAQKTKREFDPTIKRALDFGTGNGILAITSSILWPEASIDAIDNDPHALPNALENVRLNSKDKNITLSVNSIEQVSGTFELITANIYAEVLCKYHDQILSHLTHNGFLILAGVMRSRAHLIGETFTEQNWHLIENRQEDDWDSFLLRKI